MSDHKPPSQYVTVHVDRQLAMELKIEAARAGVTLIKVVDHRIRTGEKMKPIN